MTKPTRFDACLQSICLATLLTTPALAQAPTAGQRLLAELPAALVPNQGQWQSPELFRMRAGGMHIFLEPTGWSFWLRERAGHGDAAGTPPYERGRSGDATASNRRVGVRMQFVGAGNPVLEPQRQQSGTRNFLVGDDANHRSRVPSYGAVVYRDMYDGIDVRVRDAGGICEYDLLLEPHADLSQVRVHIDGARGLELASNGSLVLETVFGNVCQPAPKTWSVAADGSHQLVACNYVLLGDGSFGFAAPERNPAQPLVVDPPLLWSSYVGGSAYDEPYIVKEDGTGKVFVAGYTESFDVPTTPGVVQSTGQGADGFLMLLDPSQPPASQIVFSTYFGGNAFDSISGVELANGLIAFSGETNSTDLPVSSGAHQSTNAGARDSFVGVMDPAASSILGLTYFGGNNNDGGYTSVHADAAGNLHISGYTESLNLPTTPNAYQATAPGGGDGYIAVFDPLVTTLTYATYLGGTANDGLWAGDLDGNGVMTLITGTNSINYPTTANAYDSTYGGGNDAVVIRFAPGAATQLQYSSYLGGSGQDGVWAVKVTPAGHLLVSGTTESNQFPATASAYQTALNGAVASTFLGGDAFLTLIDPNASGAAGLVASTYFGGNSYEQGYEADIDSNGEITMSGWVNVNSNLPTTPGAMRRTPSLNDGFLARFSADLSQLLYSSYVGGSGHDGAWLLDRHADGIVTVFGQSQSFDVPTLNGFQMNNPGGDTPWVGRYQTVPTNTSRRGAPTTGSNGNPTIHAVDDATLGNAQFGVACTRAPANAAGLLAFSWVATPATPLLGVDLWLDPASAVTVFVQADATGETTFGFPLPNFVFGTLHAQYLWLENVAPIMLSASDALQIN